MSNIEIAIEDVGPSLVGRTILAKSNMTGQELSGVVEATGDSLLGKQIRLRGGDVVDMTPPKKKFLGGTKPDRFSFQVWLVE